MKIKVALGNNDRVLLSVAAIREQKLKELQMLNIYSQVWETDYKCYKCSDKLDEDSQDFSGDVCKNCCNCQFNGS